MNLKLPKPMGRLKGVAVRHRTMLFIMTVVDWQATSQRPLALGVCKAMVYSQSYCGILDDNSDVDLVRRFRVPPQDEKRGCECVNSHECHRHRPTSAQRSG
jgi:hypothetical protein